MNKLKSITLILLVMVSAMIYLYYHNASISAYVEHGVLDLSATPFNETGIVSLNGEWEFFANKLLSPKDISELKDYSPAYFKVPKKWNNIGNAFRGCGTYRLVIKNITPELEYGLIKKNIRIASNVFINGELVMKDGHASNFEAEEIMGNSPQVIGVDLDTDVAEIIIQVSNYKYYSGGIVEEIRFGRFDSIIKAYRQKITFESIIFAMVIAIGIMHGILVLFILHMKDKRNHLLLLPISVITFAIINGTLSERVIKLIFPSISTELLIRIEYVAISLLIMSLFSLIHLLEGKLLPKLPYRIIQAIYGTFILAILFMPMKNNYFWTIFTYFTTVIIAFGFIRVLILYILNSRFQISQVEHTIILILLYIVNIYNLDLFMFTFKHMNNMNIALLSTIGYGLAWFSWMAYQYHEAYRNNETLSMQLIDMNKSLENEVRLRTDDLEIAIDQLSKMNEQLSLKSAEMERLATTDTLTNINNRFMLDEAFKREMNLFERYGQKFSIILIDLDSFKKINDEYGHQVGDVVLKECAALLVSNIRKVDIIGRWGGEEFMVICPNTSLEGVRAMAEVLRKKVDENLFAGRYKVTISLGIADFNSKAEMMGIFKRADNSLYDAKCNGKNRVGAAF